MLGFPFPSPAPHESHSYRKLRKYREGKNKEKKEKRLPQISVPPAVSFSLSTRSHSVVIASWTSLCELCWPSHHRDPHASASQVSRLRACSAMPGIKMYLFDMKKKIWFRGFATYCIPYLLLTSGVFCPIQLMDNSTTFNILRLPVSRPSTSIVLLRFWILGCVKQQPSLGKYSDLFSPVKQYILPSTHIFSSGLGWWEQESGSLIMNFPWGLKVGSIPAV